MPSANEKALEAVRLEALRCRACPLWRTGTQTVFGAGPAPAPLMFVGEQPGDKEDLVGEQIPFEARLVSVADAFDAMTSVRPYRPSLSVKHAMSELEKWKGVQFDPDIVKAFLRAYQEGTSLPIPTPQLQPLRLPTRAMEARRA